MANPKDKVAENVPGKFYVDRSCIYCGLCDQTAPTAFRECSEQGWAYVYRQPDTPEEIAACIQAVEGCPTASIGADGDQQIPQDRFNDLCTNPFLEKLDHVICRLIIPLNFEPSDEPVGARQ